MDKKQILSELTAQLKDSLKALLDAAKAASQPTGKNDDEGESTTSYLDGAQAKKAEELQSQIERLEGLKMNDFSSQSTVDLTALVQVEVDSQQKRWFFVLPVAGGAKITLNGQDIHVVTQHSPLGKLLMEQRVGDTFERTTKDGSADYEIIGIH